MPPKNLDQTVVDTIRTLSMDAVQAANSGHPGTPMALAPLGWALFSKLRKHNPADPDWADRDRFVLSCGHASMLQYALLHLSGYPLSLDEIKNFRQWESLTPGHPEVHHTPGVEITTGPLGQGVATAVGMAMAERHLAKRFNRDGHYVVDHHTWVIASDGDIMEGVCQEAASFAGHLQLGKLIVFWDDNDITIDGRTTISYTEDTLKRFEAYGWQTLSVEDGNDIDALVAAAEKAKADPRPSFVRVRTVIGYPAPNKKDTSGAHGAPLGEDEIASTKEILGVPAEKFYVPADVETARKQVLASGEESQGAWNARFEAYKAAHPELAAMFEKTLAGELPDGWDSDLPVFPADAKGLATRKASGSVLSVLAEKIPSLVGGSADLAGSNNTYQKGLADFSGETCAASGSDVPRNVHFGIREHAMGSACNGMVLHGGVHPYAATFLIFSDYMRPAIRLGSLMDCDPTYVFTHDSIGLGEDGPTHQPIEQLASLRAIPGVYVVRPADANETREAWKVAMTCGRPTALALTRQDVPTLDREKYGAAEGLQKGAYVLSEAEGGAAQAVLIGTGSEVSLALEAQAKLAADGIRARVVSMPCWELFDAQDVAYRDSVLPRDVKATVVIEAGTSFGWARYANGFVSLDHFGASAPAEVLYERFGITSDAMVREVKRLLA